MQALVQRIDAEQGRLDILVNDIWGGEDLIEWNTPVWAHDLDAGLRMLHTGVDTHLITSHFALPLLIRRPGGLVVEMTDGTREYNAGHYRVSVFYDLAKNAVLRLAFSQAEELKPFGCTAVALTPGWMRSEMMLETLRRHRGELARRRRTQPALRRDLGKPALRRPRRRGPRRRPGRARAAPAAPSPSGGLAREYGFTDVDGSRPDCWRYLVEVQEAGPPGGCRPGTAEPPRAGICPRWPRNVSAHHS